MWTSPSEKGFCLFIQWGGEHICLFIQCGCFKPCFIAKWILSLHCEIYTRQWQAKQENRDPFFLFDCCNLPFGLNFNYCCIAYDHMVVGKPDIGFVQCECSRGLANRVVNPRIKHYLIFFILIIIIEYRKDFLIFVWFFLF